jgi:branched-chain amino acid transport system permease protein
VLGLQPYRYKLLSFVTASFLATVGGIVYVLLLGGANPGVAGATFTLTLLVMVVLGGTGTLWGAVLGGALYTYLNQRLISLSGSDFVDGLPGVLQGPLSEPLFILGALFVGLVIFFPGGIAGLRNAAVGRRLRALVDRALGRDG